MKNVGKAAPTLNEDLVVNLYEGHPATNPLQILCKDVILDLEPGKFDRVKAQWRPAPGTTKIYAVVNPAGEKEIEAPGRELKGQRFPDSGRSTCDNRPLRIRTHRISGS